MNPYYVMAVHKQKHKILKYKNELQCPAAQGTCSFSVWKIKAIDFSLSSHCSWVSLWEVIKEGIISDCLLTKDHMYWI